MQGCGRSTAPAAAARHRPAAAPAGCGTGSGRVRAAPAAPPPGEGRFYSPLVLSIARTEGVSMEELERLPGTGDGGRVSKKDILAYVQARKSGASRLQPPRRCACAVRRQPHRQAVKAGAGDERIANDERAAEDGGAHGGERADLSACCRRA